MQTGKNPNQRFHRFSSRWFLQRWRTYQADERSEELPAELPPDARSVTNHVLNVLVEPFSSWGVKPG